MQNSAVIFSEALGIETKRELSFRSKATPSVGKFERLPKWLNCVPLVVQWLWLSLCYRSFTLPSAANPHITCGGMVGEGKLEYFDQMGPIAASFTAPHVSIYMNGCGTVKDALAKMDTRNLAFPVIIKPNLGWCGYGVRLLHNQNELGKYLHAFPKGETAIIQKYLSEQGEAGLFYVRHPNEAKGKVIGITLRYFPQVIGDGLRTIQQLIEADLRLQRVEASEFHEPAFDPDVIPDVGEKIRLATIGSTRVGGLYCDGGDSITEALNDTMDAIAKDMKDFYIGRFDVRYENLADLEQGKGFTIMEVNGAGSESVHAWDPKYTIRDSYNIIFAKQRLLFEIGKANGRKGYKPVGLRKLVQLHFKQQRLIRQYPLSN